MYQRSTNSFSKSSLSADGPSLSKVNLSEGSGVGRKLIVSPESFSGIPRKINKYEWEFVIRTTFSSDLPVRPVFVVRSNGRQQAVHRKLFLKLVYDNLSKEEMIVYLLMPQTLKSPLCIVVSKLLADGHPKKNVREYIESCPSFKEKNPSRLEYNGYRSLKMSIERQVEPVITYKNKKKEGKFVSNSSYSRSSDKSRGEFLRPPSKQTIIDETIFTLLKLFERKDGR